MIELLKRFEKIKEDIKKLEEEKKSIQAEIKLYMINNNLEKHRIDNFNIYYNIQKRNNLNRDLLKNYISEDDLKNCYTITEIPIIKILSDETLSKMKGFMKK